MMKFIKWFLGLGVSLFSGWGNLCSICSGQETTTLYLFKLWEELRLAKFLPYLNILVVIIVDIYLFIGLVADWGSGT